MQTAIETSNYAWIIDKDHLAGEYGDCAGVIGPRDAAGESKAELAAAYPYRHQFRMYDDDGELYVTGTLYWRGNADPGLADPYDEITYGPLRDYGEGGLGCVLIKYTGKPEYDCG